MHSSIAFAATRNKNKCYFYICQENYIYLAKSLPHTNLNPCMMNSNSTKKQHFLNYLLLLSYLVIHTTSAIAQDFTKQEKNMSAYLMVFHQDETHSLHMAVSLDEIGRASCRERG